MDISLCGKAGHSVALDSCMCGDSHPLLAPVRLGLHCGIHTGGPEVEAACLPNGVPLGDHGCGQPSPTSHGPPGRRPAVLWSRGQRKALVGTVTQTLLGPGPPGWRFPTVASDCSAPIAYPPGDSVVLLHCTAGYVRTDPVLMHHQDMHSEVGVIQIQSSGADSLFSVTAQGGGESTCCGRWPSVLV